MQRNSQKRESTHAIVRARVAGVMVAFGALGLSLVAADTAGAATGVVVSTNKTAKQGTFLVSGKPLYTLKPSKTSCGSACLKFWPRLVLPAGVTAATAGSGVSATKLGTVTRSGGVLQVTYGGKPLYFFVGDTSAKKVTGDITDKWGKWSVVVTKTPSGSSSGAGSTANSGAGNSSAGTGGVSF
jgi:predicted lipoprotein with Yx(FWY)xxD motif